MEIIPILLLTTTFLSDDDYSCEPTTCTENFVCNDDLGFVSCDCKEGKVGYNCDVDDPCVRNTTNCPEGKLCFANCPPNIVCEGDSGYPRCLDCVRGWTGVNCEKDANECEYEGQTLCQNGGVCVNTVGSYKCDCKPDWTGIDCNCKRGSECDPPTSRTVMPTSSTFPTSGTVMPASSTLIISLISSVVPLSLSLIFFQ